MRFSIFQMSFPTLKKEKCAFAHLYFDQYTMQGEKQQPELTAGAGTAILEKTERRYRK